MNTEIVIFSAVRTPVGRFGGGLKDVSAAQLGAVAARAALERAELSPEDIDETIFGCAKQAGNGPNSARQIAYHTGVLIDRSAYTINKACAGGMAVEHELKWDVERRNVHGGAVALGHPTGCSGARILVTLLHVLRTRDQMLDLATLCVSGGLGMAVAEERA